MRSKVVLGVCIALAISASATSHHPLFPPGKEVVYNWQALVQAGTLLPTTHASQFVLNGKIHVQGHQNSTRVKLTDLTYTIYNGILNHEDELKSHSLQVQIPDLEKVFSIVHNSHGLAIGITTDHQEKEFSRNIKKAIATIFQMESSVFQPQHRHHSFVIKEHSIYGQFDVDYNVKHHQNGDVEVDKLHDMHDPSHLYQNLITHNEQCHCDVSYENPINHESRKRYFIEKRDGIHIIRDIVATGALIYHPFRATSDHQFIMSNQTLHLSQVVPIQKEFVVNNENFEDHLTYHSFTDTEDGSIHDVTNGRREVNYEILIPNIQHMLQDFHRYLDEDHINTHEPDSKRGQMVNRLRRLLQFCSSTKLQELHEKLTGDSRNVFYHILPLVGTKASTLFIKHLVVNKVVTGSTANQMLQILSHHVVEPTLHLLSQLEELIHLGDDIPWEIRQSAILCFGTLVHKSHMFTERVHRNQNYDHHVPHTDSYSHQQPYEKYVQIYINKIRSSQDHKVRVGYTFGLCNMQLHSISHHMLPMVNGEWFNDHHSRLLGLWAVGSSATADKDQNRIIETIWPIFVDKDEITEMRLIAFHFLMNCNLNPARLMNLVEYLMHEPNEEVYSFVYSHLQEIITSSDVCYRDFRIHARQLITNLPPPTHGSSFSKIHDHMDVEHGFGHGIEECFGNGNQSLMYGIRMKSQQFNHYYQNYFMYIKIYGMQTHRDPIGVLTEIVRKKSVQTLTNDKQVRIECVLVRHGQVIDIRSYDHTNLHSFLELLTKDSFSLVQNYLEILYHQHQQIIPTDLGTPAIWEHVMPMTVQVRENITKETVNKVINVHVDNKYVLWYHYRHGLSFYNPVADVWHGINRYISHDAVLPLHFDLSINTQQRSMQLSWQKHSQHNVAGIKSHVKQMVFVKDDQNRNVLLQSSPHCKEFVIVGHGKQFRNDYTIIHDDDLTTGHRWHVSVFDSSTRASNGSFSHLIDNFMNSHHHADSPLDLLFMTYLDFYQHILMLPKPATYGFMARIEPSQQHAVSNIDLSLRLHSDPPTDDSHYYAPKTRWSTRMTYSVKNQEQSLKTWDINTILDMNPGHTINNLKMHITRIVPGQRDYKICVDGVKKYTQKGVEGHLNVAMSQTSDGKCVKDDTVIDVVMTGRPSKEQVDGRHKYGSCEQVSPLSVQHRHSLQCLADHTTARHYVYNVKTVNVPTEFKKTFAHWWDIIKGYCMSYYTYEDEHQEDIGENNLKLDVEYPMQGEEVDVHVTTPQLVYRLTGVPTHQIKWFGLFPDAIEYPKWFQFLHHIGFVDHCVVEPDHYHLNRHVEQEIVPSEWTLYAGKGDHMGVHMKRVQTGELGVKVIDHGHTVEILPHGATHQISFDGHVVPVTEYHHEDWIYCHVFSQDWHHPVACMLQNSGVHVEYHHNQVTVVVPKVEQLQGRCYSHY